MRSIPFERFKHRFKSAKTPINTAF